MPEVVCDTSALQYLHQLGLLSLLRDLYGRIIIPDAVTKEIDAGKKAGVDLPDIQSMEWIQIVAVTAPLATGTDLGTGELAVLALAQSMSPAVAVIDDGSARQYARTQQILFTGTCGILLRAKERGLVPKVTPFLDRLSTLGFHLDSRTRNQILSLAGEQREANV
jgi:predicted nucleic acid-binding protein